MRRFWKRQKPVLLTIQVIKTWLTGCSWKMTQNGACMFDECTSASCFSGRRKEGRGWLARCSARAGRQKWVSQPSTGRSCSSRKMNKSLLRSTARHHGSVDELSFHQVYFKHANSFMHKGEPEVIKKWKWKVSNLTLVFPAGLTKRGGSPENVGRWIRGPANLPRGSLLQTHCYQKVARHSSPSEGLRCPKISPFLITHAFSTCYGRLTFWTRSLEDAQVVLRYPFVDYKNKIGGS